MGVAELGHKGVHAVELELVGVDAVLADALEVGAGVEEGECGFVIHERAAVLIVVCAGAGHGTECTRRRADSIIKNREETV